MGLLDEPGGYYTGGGFGDPSATQSLKGSEKNIAADMHFTRYMAMASGDPDWLSTSAQVSKELASSLRQKYGDAIEPFFSTREANGKPVINFKAKSAVKKAGVDMADLETEPTVFASMPKDNEYRAFEDYMHEIGKELGMTGPQVQANLWMGAGDRTGLAEESQGTFMELFRQRADSRAKKETMKPVKGPDGREVSPLEQIIKRFIRDRGLLAVPAAGGAAAIGGGLLGPADTEGGY